MTATTAITPAEVDALADVFGVLYERAVTALPTQWSVKRSGTILSRARRAAGVLRAASRGELDAYLSRGGFYKLVALRDDITHNAPGKTDGADSWRVALAYLNTRLEAIDR